MNSTRVEECGLRPASSRALLAFALLVASLSACKETPLIERIAGGRCAGECGKLTFSFPLADTVVPPGLPPPLFDWDEAGDGADIWLVEVKLPAADAPVRYVVYASNWRPTDAQWQGLKQGSVGAAAQIKVSGVRRVAPEQIVSVGQTNVTTSADKVHGSLFYREVILPFLDAVKDPSRIRWRFGSVNSLTPPKIVLTGLPVCGNCHSFSADGGVLGMDVDYANDKGSYAIAETATRTELRRDDIISWSDFRREDGEATFGLLSQVSPDGRYVISTVKDRSIFVPRPKLAYSQLFFPIKGILAVYDRETRVFSPLPGADDPAFVQSNPSWSPDGRTIVFARAKADTLKLAHDNVLLSADESAAFLKGGRKFRFDLYSVPFNGGRGGKAVPLPGASNNGRSNFFARYSPDGRFIVFTQADSFMLLQPDSTLHIMPAQGGKPRRMRCNTDKMNSWHSWSTDGRWLVFSSKAQGPYTKLYLTHVDQEGNDTPAVPLDRLTEPDRAANIPEFVNLEPGAIESIVERFVDDVSFMRAGGQNLRASDLKGAEQRYRKALALNPNNADGHKNLGAILAHTGRRDEAIASFEALLKLRPDDADGHNNLGNVLAHEGRHQEALPHLRKGLATRLDSAQAHTVLGKVLTALGHHHEAVVELSRAVELDPKSQVAKELLKLARASAKRGQASQ